MKAAERYFDWLFILPSDTVGGGAEQLQLNLVKYLVQEGSKCIVFILSKKSSAAWDVLNDKCKIIYLPLISVYLSYMLMFPILIYYTIRYRIRYTFSSQTLINGLFGSIRKLGFFRKTKIVVRESNSIFQLLEGKKLKLYNAAYKLGYSKVDLLICQTEYMKNRLLEALPWLQDQVKIIVLPNPIDLSGIRLKEGENIEDIEKMDYLVAAGRLVPVKGFDLLLKAFVPISEKYPDLKLIILGEGYLKEDLKQLSHSLDLGEKVIFRGFVSNVYPYFRQAKLCVMSSRIEGFPNVLLQMMSQNTKVVSTISAGGIDQIDGIFTCPVDDLDGLIKEILDCLENDTSGNRRKFNDDLSKRTVASFLEQVHENLANC